MFSLFAPDDMVTVEFDGGTKVVMHKFITAGVHEEADLETNRARFIQTKQGEQAREVVLNAGRLTTLRSMIIRVIMGDGTIMEGPFSEDWVRTLSREAYMLLLEEIDRHNIPFWQVREEVRKELEAQSHGPIVS